MTDAGVVADKEQSIKSASEIASKLMQLVANELKELKLDDDPAEQIYISTHIAARFLVLACMAIDGYGQIYGVQSLTSAKAFEWITEIYKETMELNKDENYEENI